MRDLWRLSAFECAQMITDGQATSQQFVESTLSRMAEMNPKINAIVYDWGTQALETAALCDKMMSQGERRGPLHGVPVTIKQNVDVKGLPNPNGLVDFKDLIAPDHAPQVKNVIDSGAVIIGMTNTPEFSFRWFTDNKLHGLSKNPWSDLITAGGSSGAAAASVAMGIGTIAHGNDIGGSLRWPAYCNGVVTIKPTAGRVPNYNPSLQGERPLLAQMTAVQGPIARTVKDCEIGLRVMSQRSSDDPFWVPAPLDYPDLHDPMKIAKAKIPSDMTTDDAVMAEVEKASSALEKEGYTIEEVELPELNRVWELWSELIFGEAMILQHDYFFEHASPDFQKAWSAYENFSHQPGVWPDIKKYMEAARERSTHLRRWSQMLDNYSAILTPLYTDKTPGPVRTSKWITDPMKYFTKEDVSWEL